MKISTKARYAVTAMLDLALYHSRGEVLSLTVITQRRELPLPYLEQLFVKLRLADLVKSTRGAMGGFSLAKEPEMITIYDIVVAVDQPVKTTQCSMNGIGCTKSGALCMSHYLWEDLGNTIQDFLKTTTLRHILCRNRIN